MATTMREAQEELRTGLAAARAASQAAQKRRERESRELAAKARALSSWVATGGTAEDFEASWPDLLAELRRSEALEAARNVGAPGDVDLKALIEG